MYDSVTVLSSGKELQQLKKGSIVQVSIDRLLIYLDEELVIDIVRQRTNRVQKSVTNEKYWGRDLKLYQSVPSTL